MPKEPTTEMADLIRRATSTAPTCTATRRSRAAGRSEGRRGCHWSLLATDAGTLLPKPLSGRSQKSAAHPPARDQGVNGHDLALTVFDAVGQQAGPFSFDFSDQGWKLVGQEAAAPADNRRRTPPLLKEAGYP